MRRSFLDLLACPHCQAALGAHAHRETAAPHGSANSTGRILEGLLICEHCSRWFPVTGELPELLPDHLRDAERDLAIFRQYSAELPEEVQRACARFIPGAEAADAGAHHKSAEIGIKGRIDDPEFFGPGYTAPFNAGNTGFTIYLLHLFGAVVPLLDARGGDVVIDSGSGYSWTTEWLNRSGITAIGVDICRTYLEIGIARMGDAHPHLVVADVEHLPVRAGCARAVLAYESFHHVPDRPRAMREYARVLSEGGRVVLAEPGGAHETADESVSVMEKYGILEKGMELTDVEGYASGAGLSAPTQIFLTYAKHTDLARPVVEVARQDSPLEGHIFLLRKSADGAAAGLASVPTDPLIAATEAPRLRSQLAGVTRQLHDTQLQLADARDSIFHMRRSAFWQLRERWLRLRRLLPGARSSDR
ncbi:MAG: methyltransferase domain-containing protein [Acidobacteria bacterium]|nr:methyltransferase domain-containing protein [Acidobacteriota bacterium]